MAKATENKSGGKSSAAIPPIEESRSRVADENSTKRAELLDLYKIAVEEYRFQVKLNVDRSRDYLVLNSAIIAAGITLIGQAQLPLVGAVVFSAGVFVAVLSMFGTHTQHGYYRDTREAKAQLVSRLGIAEMGLVRTEPSGSRYRRFGSVTRFNYIILFLLCVVDLTGALAGFGILPLLPKRTASQPSVIVKHSPRTPSPVSRAPQPKGGPVMPLKNSGPGLPAHPAGATHLP